jgi:hypothetical protein
MAQRSVRVLRQADRVKKRNQSEKAAVGTGRTTCILEKRKKPTVIKKIMAGAAVAASVVGASAMVAPQAMAVGDSHGTTSASGNGASDSFGNAATKGNLSPQATLVGSSLNKLCLGLPVKANAGSLVGILVPVAVQDIDVLSNPQNQQCADNSTQAKGDEDLSHIADQIPVLSGNGTANG